MSADRGRALHETQPRRNGNPSAGGIPIIAASGVEAEARDCLQRGALDFLPKPVSLDLLREVLRYAEVWTDLGCRRGDAARAARLDRRWRGP